MRQACSPGDRRRAQIIGYALVAALMFFICPECRGEDRVYGGALPERERVILGDEQFDEYSPLLKGKRVALFVNHSGIVGDKIILSDGSVQYGGFSPENTPAGSDWSVIPFGSDADGNAVQYGEHILDFLLARGISVSVVFAPEHGFRGTDDDGVLAEASADEKTGVPLLPLPESDSFHALSKENMDRFDVLLVDIQDLGLRYYTCYISLYYLMDACAAKGKPVIILDRPNPNGFYVDGEVLKSDSHSSEGQLPLPVVYGMTLGELARMINGEGWLSKGKNACDLTVIPCRNYTHTVRYPLIKAPSPDLKDMRSVYLYAPTCFFENTSLQVDLLTRPIDLILDGGIQLSYLLDAYKSAKAADVKKIKEAWKEGCEAFKESRKPYLLYSENRPRSKWQADVTFPDWMSNANFAANNSRSFRFYHGQGTVYLTVSEECKSFSLYINDSKIKTKSFRGGKTYAVDISKYTRDGLNTLQVSDIIPAQAKNAVRVQIPFPTVQEGPVKDSGISKDSLALIDRIISSDIKNGFTGAQLAVIKDGRLVYQNAWGAVLAYGKNGPVENQRKADNETLYDLASVSKMFTVNYAIQSLVTDGLLSLDTKIIDILGDEFAEDTISIQFKNKEKIPLEQIKEWKRNITVRDVITHTAGFDAGYPYFNDNYDIASGAFNVGSNKNRLYSGSDGSEETRKKTLRQIFRTPLVYEPHTNLTYSDIDYMLLCFVVEKVSGRRMDSFLKATFWSPMELSRISYNPLENGFEQSDCAATDPYGSTWSGKIDFSGKRTDVVQGRVHDSNAYHAMGGISGHAGLFANASDLARLASVMLTGGYGEHSFFSRDVLDVFVSPQSLPYADFGMGWWRQGEFKTVKHFGTLCSSAAFGHQGFTGTLAFIEPEENLVIVYLTNKINTPMVKGKELANQFEGNFYQSAVLGFVPQIILLGLDKKVSRAQWKSLVHDMVDDARRKAEREAAGNMEDVRWKAYESLKSVYDSL